MNLVETVLDECRGESGLRIGPGATALAERGPYHGDDRRCDIGDRLCQLFERILVALVP
jgi:hypothetical protein